MCDIQDLNNVSYVFIKVNYNGFKRTCAVCGKSFIGTQSKACCCSDTCRRVYKNRLISKYHKEHKDMIYRYNHICKGCGKSFKGTKNQLYCTNECYLSHQPVREARYDHICLVCGKSFKSVRDDSKYCSDKCRYAFHNAKKRAKKLLDH